MKITTKAIFSWDNKSQSYKEIYSDYYLYNGEVDYCQGAEVDEESGGLEGEERGEAEHNINKRLFGDDILPRVKAKLIARQELSKKAHAPGESIDSSWTYEDAMGGADKINFKGLADLSSRTPIARIWTAIKLISPDPTSWHVSNDYNPASHGGTSITIDAPEMPSEHAQNHDEQKYNIIYAMRIDETGDGQEKVMYRKKGEETKYLNHEPRVYMIGNHALNVTSEPNKTVQDYEKASIPYEFETNQNEFMRPPAGITNITSETQGSLGLLKKTTISFIVHNFHDYDKIYSKYFLRPGAQIFVDFGWDTANLYHPSDLIDETKLGALKRGNDIHEVLWGYKGYVTKSAGDLETLIGYVTNYTSTVKQNGSVECTIDLLSRNMALFGQDITAVTQIKNAVLDDLDNLIKVRMLAVLPNINQLIKGTADLEIENKSGRRSTVKDFNLDKDVTFWISGSQSITRSGVALGRILFQYFGPAIMWNPVKKGAKQEKGLGRRAWRTDLPLRNTPPTIKKLISKSGLFWNAADRTDDFDNSSKLYITWGQFEDLILNTKWGSLASAEENPEHLIRWNSSESFVRISKQLWDRQLTVASDADQLTFIYPRWWTTPGGTERTVYDEFKISETEAKLPLRELFIQVETIKSAFRAGVTIEDSINNLLEQINENSYNIFMLTVGTNDGIGDSSTVSIIDRNLLRVEEPIKKDPTFFENLFMFKPMSPNTIVKEYNLSYDTPSSEYSSMIAISTSSPGRRTLPINDIIDRAVAIRDLNPEDLENTEAVFVPAFPPVTNIDALAAYQTIKKQTGEDSLRQIIFQGIQPVSDLQPATKDKLFHIIEEVKSEDESPEEQKNINDPDKDILTASNLIDYYGKIAKMDFFKNSLSTLFPVTLTLSIYGISSLIPGNCVRVDYMPERYRDRVYFQIMKITHSISNTWTTTFDLQYRIRPAAITGQVEPKPTYLKTKSIYVNKGYLKNLKHWDKYKNMFGKITPLKSRFRNIDQIFRATLYPQNRPDKDKEDQEFYLIEDTLPKIQVTKLFALLTDHSGGHWYDETVAFPAPGMPSDLFDKVILERQSPSNLRTYFLNEKMWKRWMEIYWGWYNLHWMPKSFPVAPYDKDHPTTEFPSFSMTSWKLYGDNKVKSTIALLKPTIRRKDMVGKQRSSGGYDKFKYMQNNEVYILVGGNNGSKKYWTVGFPYELKTGSIPEAKTDKPPPLIGQASPSLYAAFCSDPGTGVAPFFNELLQEYRNFGDSGVITPSLSWGDKEDLSGYVGASQARRWVGAKIFNEKVKQYRLNG